MKIYPRKDFKIIRTKKGYTGALLAARVGLSRQMLNNFEQRRSGIGTTNAYKITKVLEEDFDTLFEIVE